MNINRYTKILIWPVLDISVCTAHAQRPLTNVQADVCTCGEARGSSLPRYSVIKVHYGKVHSVVNAIS